jgi:SulP family sulfate permease
MRSGGDNLAGEVSVAFMILVLFLFGNTYIVPYVPIVVVGSMLFYLAICLILESFYDTWKAGIGSLEYFTIFFISFAMMFMGFTEGIIAGTLLACILFIFEYSRFILV